MWQFHNLTIARDWLSQYQEVVPLCLNDNESFLNEGTSLQRSVYSCDYFGKNCTRFQTNRSYFRLIDKVREELIRLNFPIGLRG